MNSTLYRYLVARPSVRGGHTTVEGTRIGVHDMIAYFLLGCDFEEVMKRFPDLTRSQMYECLAFTKITKQRLKNSPWSSFH